VVIVGRRDIGEQEITDGIGTRDAGGDSVQQTLSIEELLYKSE